MLKKILLSIVVLAGILSLGCEETNKRYHNTFIVNSPCEVEIASLTRYHYLREDDKYIDKIQILLSAKESAILIDETKLDFLTSDCNSVIKSCSPYPSGKFEQTDEFLIIEFLVKSQERTTVKFRSKFVCVDGDTLSIESNCFTI